MSIYIPPGEPEVVYVSRRHIYKDEFGNDKAPLRYANMDFDSPPQDVVYQMATVKGKVVLRKTKAGRRNLRATFSETDRQVGSLDINHYTDKTGNLHPKGSVTLHGKEIGVLINFIETMKRVKLPVTGSVVLEPGALEHPQFVSDYDVTNALKERPELLREVLKNPNLSEDLRAIGYWRRSLEEFKALLTDTQHFENARQLTANQSAETVLTTNNTFIIGDFNMNPFEYGMVAASAFHSVPCQKLLVQKRESLNNDHINIFLTLCGTSSVILTKTQVLISILLVNNRFTIGTFLIR